MFLNNRKNLFILTSFRRLSSFNNNRTKSGIISIIPNDDFSNIWSENNWSEFSKQFNYFKLFPLPGQTGVTYEQNRQNLDLDKNKKLEENNNRLKIIQENLNYLLNKPLTQENQIVKLREAAGGLFYLNKMGEDLTNPKSHAKPQFELKAYQCPKSLMNDFQNYFRLYSISETPLTIITVSFKTENDMATWNNKVDNEREFITQLFVDTASNLCKSFEEQGFWADFVDPSSGNLAKSPYTHVTFYETDERYRHLGFEIIDHGCCKVISHHKWGTKTYVGCLITNASLNGKFVKDTIKKNNLF